MHCVPNQDKSHLMLYEIERASTSLGSLGLTWLVLNLEYEPYLAAIDDISQECEKG